MAVRTMLAVAREEVAVVTSEIAISARTAAVETSGSGAGVAAVERNAVMEVMNPVAVRQAAEASVKAGAEDCSLLTHHLSHAPPSSLQSTTTTSLNLTAQTLNPSFTSASSAGARGASASASAARTMVSQTLEEEMGVTLKDVMNNAAQTGVEEQMDQVAELAKTLVGTSAGAGSGASERVGGTVLAEMREQAQMVV